ncbi:maoC domain protein [alpha proteobacterium U9-1i]|nr:maoC domain protein [alpha proteobacterium U9-1i]
MSGMYLEDFSPDQEFITAARTVTEADIVIFTGLSGDFNPLHVDEEYAKQTQHGTRIAQGLLGASIASGLVSQLGHLRGTALGFLGMTWRYTGVIRAGDTIHVRIIVKEARASASKPDRGVLVRQLDVLNQRDEVVQTGEWSVLMLTRPKAG